jgi:hypothetical protein
MMGKVSKCLNVVFMALDLRFAEKAEFSRLCSAVQWHGSKLRVF